MSTAVRFAERMSRLGTEGAFEVLARARKLEAEGKRIVHLEIGEPDFATPDNIVEAAIGAMQNGYTHYTPASGIYEAREAVAGFVGSILTEEDIDFVCDLVEKHDLLLVSDEIYSQLVYGFHHVSPLSRPGMRERTVLMDGLSKSYAMTGWRLGYAVAPRALAAKLDTLMINSSSCAAAFTQIAAIEALGSPESEHAVRRMVKVFEHRRDLVVDGMNDIPGMRCASPQGAFYAFPNIEGTGFDEHELANRLLNEAGVAVLPGTAFGRAGKGFIRLAYTQSEDELKLGLRRIKGFVAANRHRAATLL